jgi:hypothetical protein
MIQTRFRSVPHLAHVFLVKYDSYNIETVIFGKYHRPSIEGKLLTIDNLVTAYRLGMPISDPLDITSDGAFSSKRVLTATNRIKANRLGLFDHVQ